MPTYIESALGDFIKTVLTRGIRTLKSPRFFPYSVFLLFIVLVTTFTAFVDQFSSEKVTDNVKDLLLFIELSAALAFIIVGTLLGRANTFVQISVIAAIIGAFSLIFSNDIIFDGEDFAIGIAAVLYILWIGIVTFSTFSLFRDLFANSTFGTVLFLGKTEDDGKVMFAYFAWVLVFINISLGYLIYSKYGDSTAILLSAVIIITLSIIATIPLLGFQKENDAFYTILTFFYMFVTIKVFLFFFKVVSTGEQSTSFWDMIFSFFIALYTIQNAAVKGIKLGEKVDDDYESDSLEEKLMDEENFRLLPKLARFLSDRGMVLLILGIVLGYHTMQIQTTLGRDNVFTNYDATKDADIVILGYEFNLLISLVIYVFSIFMFIVFPSFRRYANPEIQRIPWLPPYEELKEVAGKIKTGEISWKKFALSMGKDAITSKFSRKKDKKDSKDKFSSAWTKLKGDK